MIPAHLPPQRVTLVLQHPAHRIDHLRQTHCLTDQVGDHLHKPGMPRQEIIHCERLRREDTHSPLHTDADQHTDEGQLRIVNAQLVEETGLIGDTRDDPEPITREKCPARSPDHCLEVSPPRRRRAPGSSDIASDVSHWSRSRPQRPSQLVAGRRQGLPHAVRHVVPLNARAGFPVAHVRSRSAG